MGYRAEVIADSISPAGHRLTTMVVSYPRFILAEMGTHRSFSKNTASSRAVPVEKMIESVEDDPFEPEEWPINQAGMSSTQNLSKFDKPEAIYYWTEARQNAIKSARALSQMRVHKQIVNRLLEPFSWTTQIISATEWDNFFKLRCSPGAQPEMQKIANMMQEAYEESNPQDPLEFEHNAWHLPYFHDIPDPTLHEAMTHAVAKAARTSYLRQDTEYDPKKDAELFKKLADSKHWSPFEHVATPCECKGHCLFPSNFVGWHQLRHIIQKGANK